MKSTMCFLLPVFYFLFYVFSFLQCRFIDNRVSFHVFLVSFKVCQLLSPAIESKETGQKARNKSGKKQDEEIKSTL